MAFLSSRRKTGESSILDIALAKGYFLLPQPCATAGAYLPLILPLPIHRWVRGSTLTKSSSPPSLCSIDYSFI